MFLAHRSQFQGIYLGQLLSMELCSTLKKAEPAVFFLHLTASRLPFLLLQSVNLLHELTGAVTAIGNNVSHIHNSFLITQIHLSHSFMS